MNFENKKILLNVLAVTVICSSASFFPVNAQVASSAAAQKLIDALKNLRPTGTSTGSSVSTDTGTSSSPPPSTTTSASVSPQAKTPQEFIDLLKSKMMKPASSTSSTGSQGNSTDTSTSAYSSSTTSGSTSPGNTTSDGFTSKNTAGNTDAQATIDTVQQTPTTSKLNTTEVSGLLKDKSGLDSQSGASGVFPVIEAALTATEIKQMQTTFQMDMAQHSQYIANNDDERALKIVLKWQYCSQIYPNKIEDITNHIAAANGYPNFKAWISEVIRLDQEYIVTK
ncbi:MAG: hypothetical protein HQM09_04700 [Candidatus Riflebacteria bacterium]|nr:hypothetical protein [Candidatus Riflebacteria bacterium]